MNRALFTTMFYKASEGVSVLRMGSGAKDSLRDIALFSLYKIQHCNIILFSFLQYNSRYVKFPHSFGLLKFFGILDVGMKANLFIIC